MKTIISVLVTLMMTSSVYGQGYKVGDEAAAFKLKNVDGKMVNLYQYPDAEGFVVIFTCNHCPYARAYEDRIIAIDKEYKPKGFPVIAINPNDATIQPDDSYEMMQERAREKGFTFPYLYDESQTVVNTYGATRTPHVYVLTKKGEKLYVRYIGAIDNNYQDPEQVTEKYLVNALEALLAGKDPAVTFTKAIGCTIKKKQ